MELHPLLQTLPISLYIHFPWCIRKCPYCDFNSHAVKAGGVPQHAYLSALLADLSVAAKEVKHREVKSIFIGGGTPSLMEPEILAELLAGVYQHLNVASDCEITLEANPGTYEKERFHAFRQAGITRLSLGIQSLNDRYLHAIGRVHNAKQAIEAIEAAQKLFPSFNLDLMYALPEQTLLDLDVDLKEILSFQPPHLSIYHLTVESNTYFSKYPPASLPDDDLASQMLDLITEKTAKIGLDRYEVSAYAKNGNQCRHNRHYWEYGDYLGIGAGAHGKVSLGEDIHRYIKYRDPDLYMRHAMEGNATASTEQVRPDERAFEFMLGALRLKQGVPINYFTERTGLPFGAIKEPHQKAMSLGLLCDTKEVIKATDKGFDFLSNLQEMFLPEQ
ncbi:MAG: radical SAM family heme chaperone HemW [Saezia sp.]